MFKHSSLKKTHREIRLLRVVVGEQSIGQLCDFAFTLETVSLDQGNLDKLPSFTAVSYVWGEDHTHVAHINIGDAKFGVSRNLRDCLENTLGKIKHQFLWIDAICIDQSNNEERSWQVDLMREIFGSAATVLIWLGLTESNTDQSEMALRQFEFDGVEALARGFESFSDGKDWSSTIIEEFTKDIPEGANRSPLERFFREILNQRLGEADPEYFDSVYQLLSRPWFSRMWVIQEYSLAKDTTFACGNTTISGSSFEIGYRFYLETVSARASVGWRRMLVSFIEYSDARGNEYMMRQKRKHDVLHAKVVDSLALFSVRQHIRQKRGLFELWELLVFIRTRSTTFNATDPRDMIYSLLGLVSLPKGQKIIPNYEKSCEEIFIEAAKMFFRDRCIELLAFAHGPKNMKLPSWVPDWTKNFETWSLPIWKSTDMEIPKFRRDKDGNEVMCVKGHEEGRVLKCASTLDSPHGLDEQNDDFAWNYLMNLESFFLGDIKSSEVKQRHRNAIISQLLSSLRFSTEYSKSNYGDLFINKKTARDLFFLLQTETMPPWRNDKPVRSAENQAHVLNNIITGEALRINTSRAHARKPIDQELLTDAERQMEPKDASFSRIFDVFRASASNFEVIATSKHSLRDRRLLSITDGRYALGTPSCQPGDVLFRFPGCCMYFVLRPIPMKPQHYTFIGDADVRGCRYEYDMDMKRSGKRIFIC